MPRAVSSGMQRIVNPPAGIAGRGSTVRGFGGVGFWLALAVAICVLSPRRVRAEGTVTTNTTTALLQAMLGGGTVQLTFSEMLTLETPLIIAADTLLEGALGGGRLVTLSGGNARRLFRVLPGVRFEIRNCVVREGLSTNGGGIYNEGTLVASNVVFAACKATGRDGEAGKAGQDGFGVGTDGKGGLPGEPGMGGGLFNLGEAILVDCIFSSNVAQGGRGGDGGDGGKGGWRNGVGGDGGPGAAAYGGAIHGTVGSRLAVTNTLFSGNSAKAGDGGAGGSDTSVLGSGHGAGGASAAGGAIHAEGLLWVVRSAFTTNSVAAGKAAPAGAPSFNIGKDGAAGGHAWGGALASWSTGAVINSTFVTNSVAGGSGGKGAAGLFTVGEGGKGGDGVGGAVHARGYLGLTNVTVAWNTTTNGVGGDGGSDLPGIKGDKGTSAGAGIAADGGRAEVVNSIIVAASGLTTVHGAVKDAGYTLFSDRGTGSKGPGSLLDSNPRFTEFKVWTALTPPGFLLQPGSPAIDSADSASAPPEDQRRLPRPAGLGPDMGAMEAGASSFFIAGQVLAGSGKQGLPGVGLEVGDLRDTTDASGRFRFGPLPAGFYTVAISGGGNGYTPRLVQIPLVADATNVVFRTANLVIGYVHPQAGSGPGTISGTGVPGRYYRLEGSADLLHWDLLGRALADAQGRVTFQHNAGGVPEWYYRLEAE